MALIQNKTTRVLIIIIGTLVVIALLFSYFYYKQNNASVDPRIVQARKLYEQYNSFAQANAFDSVFVLMNAIESVYASCPHYKESWETGVLYNNRAAAYLTMTLHNSALDSLAQDSLLHLAEIAVNRSIVIYQNWLEAYEKKSKVEITNYISDEFFAGLEKYTPAQKKVFLDSRLKEIEASKIETKRRLSVSYTNLGIIYRQRHEYEAAAVSYKKAIDLWDRNLTAENNLNILLGRPMKKRNFLQKLFPPDRDDN